MSIGLTLQQLEGWEGQFDRVSRFLKRAQDAALRNQSEDEMDFVLATFQNALNLRDWIQVTCPKSRRALERLFRDSVEMRICRDLANGFKHMKIGIDRNGNSRASVDHQFSIVFSYFPRGGRRGDFVVLAGGHQFKLLELAVQCVEQWKTFIRDNALMPSSVARRTALDEE